MAFARTQIPLNAAMLLAAVALATGCAHTSRIEADPPGAEVYVNGERVGHAPVDIEDGPGFSDSYEVSIQKDGYELKQVTLEQGEWFLPHLLLGAVLTPCSCGLAWLYFGPRSRVLEDRYGYALKRKAPLPPVDGAAPPPPGDGTPPGDPPAEPTPAASPPVDAPPPVPQRAGPAPRG